MNRNYRLTWVIVLAIVAGCGTSIPPRLEVKDPASGRTYQTYQPWGHVEKGVGYTFTDVQTGKMVTLTNYEIKTLETKKTVPSDSPDAKAYKEAKARGGVK